MSGINGEDQAARRESGQGGSAGAFASTENGILSKGPHGSWNMNFMSSNESFMHTDSHSTSNTSVADWGSTGANVEGNGSSMTLSTWGANPLGAGTGPTMQDITNKQQPSSQSASSSSSVNNSSSGATNSVWQSSESGDSSGKNSWGFPSSSAQQQSGGASAGGSQPAKSSGNGFGGNGGQTGQDKENAPITTQPVPAERTPMDNMIYRDGWGQNEIKQDVPWPVPDSPPPVNEDPSMWKPKANTGTEVWEKSTGHRTQPWQNQGPNTPRWMSDDHSDMNSVWSGVSGNAQMPSGPLSSGGIRPPGMMTMPGGNGGSGMGSGDAILNGSMNGPGSQSTRPSWNSNGGSGGNGSGSSSAGNISPTNQVSDNQTDWSDWHSPGSRKEADDGTSVWGSTSNHMMQQRPPNGPYSGGSSGPGGMSSSMDRNKMPTSSDMAAYQQRKPGWSGGPGFGPQTSRMSSSDWDNDNNEWSRMENEKGPQWDSNSGARERSHQPQQRSYSPTPNGVTGYRNGSKLTREQQQHIYSTKQYRDLLEMGFKRDDIDAAMVNNNMNYEATVSELRRRRQAQQQQFQLHQQSPSGSHFGMGGASGGNDGAGGYHKTGLSSGSGSTGGASGGVPVSMHQAQSQSNPLMQQQSAQQQANKGPSQARPAPGIQAVAQQLSMAARQGVISSRLLNQPLAPQSIYLLHKLMQTHRTLQQYAAQENVITSQKNVNPMQQQMQQQQLTHLTMQSLQLKKDIFMIQKQIDLIQADFLKSPTDPRFQGGPTLVDLVAGFPSTSNSNAGMDWSGPASGVNNMAPAAAGYAPGQNATNWRMPEPNYTAGMGAGDWTAGMGAGAGMGAAGMGVGAGMGAAGMGAGAGMGAAGMAGAGAGFVNQQMNPMWNDPHSWAAQGQGAMGWRASGPGMGQGGMDDWTGGAGGQGMANHLKMAGGVGGVQQPSGSMSPSRGASNSGTGNGASGYGMDEADGSWGNRQMDSNSFSSFVPSRFAWDTLPEFEPGKPWRGSQVLSADEDPHMTPGSVAKSPLLNAVASGGSGHYTSNDQ